MGRLHAASIATHPMLGQFTVCDSLMDAARSVATEFGAKVMSVNEALACSGFDAIIIASPARLHLDHTARAVKTGSYVFCEKPLGLDLASIKETLPQLTPYAGRIQLGFNRRFDPHMAALKARLDAGEIGEIEQLHIISRDHKPPRVSDLKNSAGLIAETAIHDFDMLRWLLGTEITQVFCYGATLVNPDYAKFAHIDTATMVLRTAKGQQVVIQNSWRAIYGYDQRIEAFGPKGRLNVSNPVDPLVTYQDQNGLRHGRIADDWSDRYLTAYRIEMHQFLDCVAANGLPTPGLNDGVMASKLAHCVQVSLDTGVPELCVPLPD